MASKTSRDGMPPRLQNTSELPARDNIWSDTWESRRDTFARSTRPEPVARERVDHELIKSTLGGIGGGYVGAMIVVLSSMAIALSRGLDPFTAPKLYVLSIFGKDAMLPGIDLVFVAALFAIFYGFGLLGGAIGFVGRYLPLSVAVPFSGITLLVAWLIQRLAIWPNMPYQHTVHHLAFMPHWATFLQALAVGLAIGSGMLLARMPTEYFRPGRHLPGRPLTV